MESRSVATGTKDSPPNMPDNICVAVISVFDETASREENSFRECPENLANLAFNSPLDVASNSNNREIPIYRAVRQIRSADLLYFVKFLPPFSQHCSHQRDYSAFLVHRLLFIFTEKHDQSPP